MIKDKPSLWPDSQISHLNKKIKYHFYYSLHTELVNNFGKRWLHWDSNLEEECEAKKDEIERSNCINGIYYTFVSFCDVNLCQKPIFSPYDFNIGDEIGRTHKLREFYELKELKAHPSLIVEKITADYLLVNDGDSMSKVGYDEIVLVYGEKYNRDFMSDI